MTTETNAERLTRIGETATFNTFENAIGTLMSKLFKDDLDWLIEQAERAQELNKALSVENRLYNKAYEDAVKLDEENRRLRKALEFYADEDNYNDHKNYCENCLNGNVDNDYGLKARQALEGFKGESEEGSS